MRKRLTDEDIAAFAPSEKMGIVATVEENGEPHLSLLTTLMADGAEGLTIGEFSRGQSKLNMRERGKMGFLVMGLDRRLWRGFATWKGLAREGAEYVAYNKQPMFRYNTYFGINTVHYLELGGVEGPDRLPLAAIVFASLATALRARRAVPAAGPPVLPPFARRVIDKLDSLSFLSWISSDGFPRIVPVLQARSAGVSRIVFTPGPWRDELRAAPRGARAAVFAMNLAMESFMARGTLTRFGAHLMGVDLDYLYNSAPPSHGQVWPPVKLEAMADA